MAAQALPVSFVGLLLLLRGHLCSNHWEDIAEKFNDNTGFQPHRIDAADADLKNMNPNTAGRSDRARGELKKKFSDIL